MDTEKKRSLDTETSGKEPKKVRGSDEDRIELIKKKEDIILVEGSKVF